MLKRISLFLLVNVLIIATLSVTMSLLGVQPWLDARGISYPSLVLFSLVWGFGGAFISLALSRVMARWMAGVKLIDPDRPAGAEEARLVARIRRHAEAAGLPKLPQIGVYESADPNAFATGPSKSRALVAVSTGLLRRFDDASVDGVLAHEIAHVANGDMVTMTLIQGVVNAFTLFLARVVAFAVSQSVREEARGAVTFGVTIALDVLFTILGSLVTAWFSRRREFRADEGGAKLAGREKMVAALVSLQRATAVEDERAAQPALAALKISGKRGKALAAFATHPSLEERIARLRA